MEPPDEERSVVVISGQVMVSGAGRGEGGMMKVHESLPLQPIGPDEGSHTDDGK
jgi:hypothetical protein